MARKKKEEKPDGWVSMDEVYESTPWNVCAMCEKKYRLEDRWSYVCTKCRIRHKIHSEAQIDRIVVWNYIRRMRFGG